MSFHICLIIIEFFHLEFYDTILQLLVLILGSNLFKLYQFTQDFISSYLAHYYYYQKAN